MHRRANISRALKLLLGLAGLGACAGAPPSVGGFEPVTLRNPVPDGALTIDALFAPRSSSFEIRRGDHAGKTLVIQSAQDGERATLTRTLADGTVLNEQRVRVRDESATEVGFRNHERNVSVELSPKQKLWPIDGVPQEMRIRLPRIDDPGKIKERGDATSVTTIESIDRIETPEGFVEAVRVRTIFESDLRAANARRVTDRWYTNERGLIAERWDEEVKAFGLTVERSARTIVIREE